MRCEFQSDAVVLKVAHHAMRGLQLHVTPNFIGCSSVVAVEASDAGKLDDDDTPQEEVDSDDDGPPKQISAALQKRLKQVLGVSL